MKTPSRENTIRINIKLRIELLELIEQERARRCVVDGGYVAQYRLFAEAVEQYLRRLGYDTSRANLPPPLPPAKAPRPVKLAKPARSVGRSRTALAKAG